MSQFCRKVLSPAKKSRITDQVCYCVMYSKYAKQDCDWDWRKSHPLRRLSLWSSVETRQYASDHFIDETETMEGILKNIVGFDLNPLAVQVLSARTNYLIALGKLIESGSDRGHLFQAPGRVDSIALPFLSSSSHGYQYLA